MKQATKTAAATALLVLSFFMGMGPQTVNRSGEVASVTTITQEIS
jgi:hypothetical protein